MTLPAWPTRTVGIIGPHDPSPVQYRLAREAGRLVSSIFGAVVLCGGLSGIMEAAAAGAQSAGGSCVGLLPGRNPADGNQFLTVAIATGAGQLRNQMIVDSSQLLVSIGENRGTVDEVVRAARAGKLVVSILGENDPPREDTRVRSYVRSAAEAMAAISDHLGWPMPGRPPV